MSPSFRLESLDTVKKLPSFQITLLVACFVFLESEMILSNFSYNLDPQKMYLFTIKSRNMVNLLIKNMKKILYSMRLQSIYQKLSDTESTHLALIGWNRCSQCCCEPSGCCWAREYWPSRGQFPNFSSWSPGRQVGRPCCAAVLPGREGRNRFHRPPPGRGIQTGMSVSPTADLLDKFLLQATGSK